MIRLLYPSKLYHVSTCPCSYQQNRGKSLLPYQFHSSCHREGPTTSSFLVAITISSTKYVRKGTIRLKDMCTHTIFAHASHDQWFESTLSSTPTSSEESSQLFAFLGIGITRCGHTERKDLDTARQGKRFLAPKIHLWMLGRSH